MNFYNPYVYTLPQTARVGTNLLGKLTGSANGLSFGNILNGTQKTLNIINQAIPIIKEATPMIRNAKTMFKIANEFKKVDTPNVSIESNNTKKIEMEPAKTNESGPTFFL